MSDENKGQDCAAVSRLSSLRQHADDVSRRTGLNVTVEPFEDLYAVTVNRPDGMVRHAGYDGDSVHGMLLGIAAATGRPS